MKKKQKTKNKKTGNSSKRVALYFFRLQDIHNLHISHNTLCLPLLFNFSWVLQPYPREIEVLGRKQGVLCEICRW